VERLEQAQQPATCPHIVSSDEGTSYCGLAEQQAQQPPAPSTPAGLVSDVAALIADFASTSRAGDDCTPAARRLILAVAAWLSSQHYFYTAADALRRELGR
jgi:hypothetical protein